ncbi:hypothetical protein [Gimesia aquarii]|nr:hypothetical protein [Gimesia aquarii]
MTRPGYTPGPAFAGRCLRQQKRLCRAKIRPVRPGPAACEMVTQN